MYSADPSTPSFLSQMMSSGGTTAANFMSSMLGGGSAPAVAAPTSATFAPDISPAELEITHIPGTTQYHVSLKAADTGRDNTLPVNFLLIGDTSGSMKNPSVDIERYPHHPSAASHRADLIKYAVKVITSGLTERQGLGLIFFDTDVTYNLPIIPMSEANKPRVFDAVTRLIPNGGTCIYSGLKRALDNIAATAAANTSAGLKNDPFYIILQTDGVTENEPNVEGEGEKGSPGALATWMESHPDINLTVHTIGYGFNNDLDTKLLQRIAKVGNGMSLYVSDGNMVITTVCHLMANCMSTLYSNVRVHIEKTGQVVYLGDLQGGKPRTTIIDVPVPNFLVKVTSGADRVIASKMVQNKTVPPATIEAMVTATRMGLISHIERALASARQQNYADATQIIDEWYSHASNPTLSAHPQVRAMLDDVKHLTNPNFGQVRLAFSSPDNFFRWGQHSVPQDLSKYTYQWPTNFKDPYSKKCCTGTVKIIYDDMVSKGLLLGTPATSLATTASVQSVQASREAATPAARQEAARTNVAPAHDPAGGCWAPDTEILDADGVTRRAVQDLRPGDMVWTPVGPARVLHLVKLGRYATHQQMCNYLGLSITPYHPILVGGMWTTACQFGPSVNTYMPTVYNLVLNQGHVVNANGVMTCTLGHGMTGPVIGHDFFGSKDRILATMSKQPGFDVGLPVYANLVPIYGDNTGMITGWEDRVDPNVIQPVGYDNNIIAHNNNIIP